MRDRQTHRTDGSDDRVETYKAIGASWWKRMMINDRAFSEEAQTVNGPNSSAHDRRRVRADIPNGDDKCMSCVDSVLSMPSVVCQFCRGSNRDVIENQEGNGPKMRKNGISVSCQLWISVKSNMPTEALPFYGNHHHTTHLTLETIDQEDSPDYRYLQNKLSS